VFAFGHNVTVAVRGSALGGSASTPYVLGGLLHSGVAYVIENCALTGFSRAVAPSVVLYNGPRVALGCNAWRPSVDRPSVALSRAVLMLPGPWVTYTRGAEGAYCPRPTTSMSATCSAETRTMVVAAIPATPPAVAALAAMTAPAAAVGFLAAATGGGALDLQSLALLGAMECSGASGVLSVGSMRYLLSPLADRGPVAVAFGNVAIVAGAALLHLAAVLAVRRVRGLTLVGAMVAALFPALPLLVLLYLLPGTLRAALVLLWSARGAGAAAGALVALAIVGAVAACTYAGARLLPDVAFEAYPEELLPRRAVLRALYPSGRWVPEATRRQYGPLLSAVRGRRRALAMQAEWYAVALALVTSADAWPSHCAAQYAAVAAVAYASACVYAVARPCRAAAASALNALSLVALATAAAVVALGASGGLSPTAAAS
jgi:hypothetical protein